jgi:hypothetical protein
MHRANCPRCYLLLAQIQESEQAAKEMYEAFEYFKMTVYAGLTRAVQELHSIREYINEGTDRAELN